MAGLMKQSLREFVESKGAQEATRLILSGLRSEDKTEKLSIDDFSLLEMAEATKYGGLEKFKGSEGVDITMFPTILDEVIQRMLLPGWNRIEALSDQLIGQELTTTDDPIRVTGITDPGEMLTRQFGGQYLETEVKELFVQTPQNKPWGRIISLKEEDIMRDRTAQLRIRAASIGESAAITKEKEFWYSFTDNGKELSGQAQYGYYPAGTQTGLYATTATADATGQEPRNTLVTSNALADITDVQATEKVLNAQTHFPSGDLVINAMPRFLIVPSTLSITARVARRTQMNEKTATKTNVRPVAAVGGIGDSDAEFTIIASKILDGISQTAWYWGTPQRTWVRAVFYPLQVLTETMGPGDSPYMTRDIVWQARARYLAKSFALDYRGVVENTA